MLACMRNNASITKWSKHGRICCITGSWFIKCTVRVLLQSLGVGACVWKTARTEIKEITNPPTPQLYTRLPTGSFLRDSEMADMFDKAEECYHD